ncbi:2426_t:CDS:2 [Paraglomus occultum]|uniref:2426_t:CDS:1 n=1 Tax=Paraglomus occultum TaxID=144539 RepID=A0A9N9C275_9GLOM|nr:2426_t:CDS:2 [Paraglomus occultum]
MNILHEKYKRLNTLYKQYEASIDDLQDALVEQLPQLKEEYDLEFVQVERLRNYMEDRGTLFRFFRRSSYDLDLALSYLLENIRWRIANNIDALSLSDIHPQYLESGLFYFSCTDIWNRPCAIFNLRMYNRDPESPTIEDMKKYIIFNCEVARRHMWDLCKEALREGKEPILQYGVLVDLNEATFSNLDFELGPFMMDLAKNQYPSSISAIFVLNYGWTYATMWRLVKRLLPEESISRIFFPTQEELLEYFDEDKIFVEHGGKDTTRYSLSTNAVFNKHANPPPILSFPVPHLRSISRVSSFDSLHEVFFSARATPIPSRSVTPYCSRPGSPFHNQPSTPYASRPASPGVEHVGIPSWLKMTPSDAGRGGHALHAGLHMPQPQRSDMGLKNFTGKHNGLAAYGNGSQQLQSETFGHNSHSSNFTHLSTSTPLNLHTSPSYTYLQELYSSPSPIPSSNTVTTSSDTSPLISISSKYPETFSSKHSLYRLLRIQRRVKQHISNMIRRFIARRVSGVFWLVMVVALRGGLMNEFWKLLTQQVTMQLGWNTNTTTALTTAALSVALSGRDTTGSRIRI